MVAFGVQQLESRSTPFDDGVERTDPAVSKGAAFELRSCQIPVEPHPSRSSRNGGWAIPPL